MHDSSLINMRNFKDKFCKPGEKVLEVGSFEINGGYREMFSGFDYTGLDSRPGPGVDVTDWKDIKPGSFDCVISGQTFEHVENDIDLIKKISEALKPGGLACIIAPSEGPKHGYPDDYRRYKPRDMRILAQTAGLEVVEAFINGGSPWWDCVLIAKKNQSGKKLKLNLGSGRRKISGYVNIDIQERMDPDLICDIIAGLPYGDNTVSAVRAHDFLEHIPIGEVVGVINEIHRVLKPGGTFESLTPSTDGRGAFQDPTHVSFWNINSWLYYTDDLYRDLYEIKAKFEVIELKDVQSDGNVVHTFGRMKKV